jgi:hypothetical protein
MSYLGQSLIINRTIMASYELNAFPFTNHVSQFDFLRNKYYRIVSSGHQRDVVQHVLSKLDMKTHEFGLRVVEAHIPNLELRSWHDIVTVRHSAREQLEYFRTEVDKFATDISASFGSPDFDEEVEKVMRRSVNPAIKELANKMKMSKASVLGKAFAKAQSIKPMIPFGLSFFVNVPLYIALLAGAGILAIDTLLDMYLEKEKVRSSSGLSYLFNYS